MRLNRVVFRVIATIVLVAATPAFGQSGMTSVDVARMSSVSDAAISPDGTMIAYVLSVPRIPFAEDTGAAWGELHIIGRDGVSRPFISGEETVKSIQWTADSSSVLFLAKRAEDEETSLYRISVSGGESQKLIGREVAISAYSLSPDGRSVAFVASEEGPEEIEELEEKGFNPVVYEEEDLFNRLWIRDLDGNDEPRQLEIEGHVSEIHWSPAGDRIIFALAPTPLVDDSYMERRIRVWNLAEDEIVASIENPGKLGEIAVSPGGQWIAAIAAEDRTDPREGRLIVAPVGGGEMRDLLPGLEGHVRHIAWMDADTMVYILDEGVLSFVEGIDVDGSNRRRLAGGDALAFASLSVSSKGDRLALTASSPTHPAEVFLSSGRNWATSRVTNSNPWLDDIRLAPQEIVRFEARDGLEIEGILIRPLDQQQARRYPLIMAVHGGPEAHHSNGWLTSYSYPGQVGAARGYAVFYTNYRGSTGRGVAFSKLSQADPAGREFDDIVDAVDHLIDIGLADRNKVGITGGSYGGYATAWGATYYSDRYAAAVMNVGISDKISKIGTSDIPHELYEVHERKWPWEDWDGLRERSPLFHVEKARTPILILHGEDDTRVHPSQSLMLYRYLKILNQTPVRLVLYPGEGHGYQKSAARLDYNLRMMRWFDHYLKGPGGDPPPKNLEYPKTDLEALNPGG